MGRLRIGLVAVCVLLAPTLGAEGTYLADSPWLAHASYRVLLPIVLRACRFPEPYLPDYSEPREMLRLYPGANLWGMRSADLNGDGWPDAVLYRGLDFTMAPVQLDILLNDGAGNLTLGTSQVFSGTAATVVGPRELILADFNGDSRVDIFVADHGMDAPPMPGGQNVLVLSAPGGKLVDATATLPQQSDITHSAAAADIDGDGDVDLYVGNVWGETMVPPAIWLNSDGAATFVPVSGRLPFPLEDLDYGAFTTCDFVDVNNDASPDLVLGDAGDDLEGGTDSLVLLNDGTGHFAVLPNAIPAKPFSPSDTALDLDACDINGDGHQDLFVVFSRWTYVGRYIQVLINNGDGTFRDETAPRLPQSVNYDAWITWVFLHDLNMDGHLDIVAQPIAGREPLFYLNDGAGAFRPLSNVFHIDHPYLFTFLDLERDGLLDVLWAYPECEDGACPETHFVVRASGCPMP